MGDLPHCEPDVVLPFLCFCQLQGSQDAVSFVTHRINEGVDLAGLFLHGYN